MPENRVFDANIDLRQGRRLRTAQEEKTASGPNCWVQPSDRLCWPLSLVMLIADSYSVIGKIEPHVASLPLSGWSALASIHFGRSKFSACRKNHDLRQVTEKLSDMRTRYASHQASLRIVALLCSTLPECACLLSTCRRKHGSKGLAARQ